jgi:AbrB family looped-hinge helix DNA binding protein
MEIVSSVTRKGQVTVPAAVRQHLGLATPDKVAFVIEGQEVRLRPARRSLEEVFGSVAPLPGRETADFDEQIQEALAEASGHMLDRRSQR